MILNVPKSMLLIVGCIVWWLLLGFGFFGFHFGCMVMYLCVSQSTSVSKSCGGGCRKLAIWCDLFG